MIVALYATYRFLRSVYIYNLDDLDRDLHSNSLNRKYIVLNLLNKEQCNAIINESEDYALKHQWTSKRHEAYPTTDNEINKSWQCYGALENRVKEVLFPALSKMYDMDPQKMGIEELFVAKYDANGQRKLEAHRDNSELSFILALNDSYTGGGTQFTETGEKVHLKTGQCMIFSGQNHHKGVEITSGTRYIVAGFLTYEGKDYCDKMDMCKVVGKKGNYNYISSKSKAGEFAKRNYTYHEGTWHPVPSITLK